MNPLSEIIRDEIVRRGPISLARFMELALYHPEWGYYEQSPRPLGRLGDFFTSVSVGGMFGELLACQFGEWLASCAPTAGPGEGLQIVEAGAHDGRLAADVLGALRERRPELFQTLEYWIVEPSPRRAALQRETLREYGAKLRWLGSLDDLPATGVRGVMFCNELLDALPVHRWGWDAPQHRWFEWSVQWEAGQFVWVRKGADSSPPRAQDGVSWPPLPPESLQAVLPDGFTIETSPAAEAWWGQAARSLRQGRLVAFDYGLTEEECFAPHRAQGTVRAYRQHQLIPDMLVRPGEQDITAHVNFTRVQVAGTAAGLQTELFREQGWFLGEVARRLWAMDGPAWSPGQIRQFQTLTHPGFLGMAFQVLVQTPVTPGWAACLPGA